MGKITATHAGVERIYMEADATQSIIYLEEFDNGGGVGTRIFLRRNSNASTPAAGFILFYDLSGDFHSVWMDNADQMRVWKNNQPLNGTDTSGTVVGTQVSWIEEKDILGNAPNGRELLQAVLAVKLYQYQMKADGQQKSDGSKPAYTGLVITKEDRNNNAWFANNLGENQTPVLNERNLFGYLIGAIQAQQEQIEELTKRVISLEAKG